MKTELIENPTILMKTKDDPYPWKQINPRSCYSWKARFWSEPNEKVPNAQTHEKDELTETPTILIENQF